MVAFINDVKLSASIIRLSPSLTSLSDKSLPVCLPDPFCHVCFGFILFGYVPP